MWGNCRQDHRPGRPASTSSHCRKGISMTDHNEQVVSVPAAEPQPGLETGEVVQAVPAADGAVSTVQAATPPDLATLEPAGDGVENANGTANRHVEAGRKGARRVHQLIQEGKLYEQEHGLKRG